MRNGARGLYLKNRNYASILSRWLLNKTGLFSDTPEDTCTQSPPTNYLNLSTDLAPGSSSETGANISTSEPDDLTNHILSVATPKFVNQDPQPDPEVAGLAPENPILIFTGKENGFELFGEDFQEVFTCQYLRLENTDEEQKSAIITDMKVLAIRNKTLVWYIIGCVKNHLNLLVKGLVNREYLYVPILREQVEVYFQFLFAVKGVCGIESFVELFATQLANLDEISPKLKDMIVADLIWNHSSIMTNRNLSITYWQLWSKEETRPVGPCWWIEAVREYQLKMFVVPVQPTIQ